MNTKGVYTGANVIDQESKTSQVELESMNFAKKHFLDGVKSYKENEMATAYEGNHSVPFGGKDIPIISTH